MSSLGLGGESTEVLEHVVMRALWHPDETHGSTHTHMLKGVGACLCFRNMFGLRALDCAETDEMRQILLAGSQGGHPLNSPLSPPASLSKVMSTITHPHSHLSL